MRRLLLPLAALAACATPLELPPEPAVNHPEVTAIAPARGVAGTHVHVTGRFFAPSARVHFGPRSAAIPLDVAPDGTALDVVVPEDAESAPLTVAVDGVEGAGPAFTFDGVDHLREGRIVRTLDVRPEFASVLPLGPRRFALFAQTPFHGVVDEKRQVLALPGSTIAAVAASRGDAPVLFLLDTLQSGSPPCPGARAGLWVLENAFTDAEERRTVCLSAPADANGEGYVDLAVDGPGTHAVLIATTQAFVVDLTATPPAVRFLANADGAVFTQVAWAGGTHFVLAGDGGLRRLDAATGALTDPEEIEPGFRDLGGLGVDDAAHVLVGTKGRVLRLADAWPPQVETRFETGSNDVVTSVATSARTGRLAAVQGSGTAGRLVLFDAAATPVNEFPLAAIPLDHPGAVSPAQGGAFHVGVKGGAAIVSDLTGALLEERTLIAGLTEPAPRLVDSSDGEGHTVELVLGSHTFDATVSYSTEFGEIDEYANLATNGARPVLEKLAGTRAAPVVFARRGREILRTHEDGSFVDRDDRFRLPESTEVYGRLFPAPDASAVGVLTRTDGVTGALVLDAAADWSTLTVPTITIDGDHLRQVVFDGAGRVAVVGEHTVRLLAGDDLRRGTVRALGQDRTFVADVLTVVAHPAGLLVVLDDGHTIRLGPDGTPTDFGVGPWDPTTRQGLREGAQLTPGSRRVYWLNSFAETFLESVTLDLATGEPLRAEPDVPLPFGVTSFAFAEDGTHAIAVDVLLDRVYQVQ